MKKIGSVIALMALIVMITTVACAGDNTNVTILNSDEVDSRIQKEFQFANLDLQKGEIGLYWEDGSFWKFKCFDDYIESLKNPVKLDWSKLEYIVMPLEGNDSRLRVQCLEEKRNKDWSFYYINCEKLDASKLKVYPAHSYSWASNVAKTYRFDMAADKENSAYYYITFPAHTTKS